MQPPVDGAPFRVAIFKRVPLARQYGHFAAQGCGTQAVKGWQFSQHATGVGVSATPINRLQSRARRRRLRLGARPCGARQKKPHQTGPGETYRTDDAGFHAQMQAARRTRIAFQCNAAGGSCVAQMPNWCRLRAAKTTPS
ncbi:hypothetical protein GCM10009076_15020 [Erythrobacter ramosus]